MATTEQELEGFMRFVRTRLVSGESEASLDELFDLWRHQTPSTSLHTENVAAIAASIAEFMAGERGSPAGEHSAELRREFGFARE